MNALGKKILSAFIELPAEEKPDYTALKRIGATPLPAADNRQAAAVDSRFAGHFTKLFAEAALPGPGYQEFSKMTEAMQVIADEKARYSAAFAGLQVQGLDKQKLLLSIQQYIGLIDTDAVAFQNTLNEAWQEKVGTRQEAVEKAKAELQQLSQQIISLQQKMADWEKEVAEAVVKINNSKSGYAHAMESYKAKLQQEIDKINQHII